MCDPGLILGLASGAASAAGEAQANKKQRQIIQRQQLLEYGAQERQRLVEVDAANKEAYQAQLEQDRATSLEVAKGEGMGGATATERVAEQQRQGALSIANAKDRATGATANYVMGGKHSQIEAQNGVNTKSSNMFTTIANVATSGLSNYGAFR